MNIGDKAPEILGKDEQGRDIRLSDYKGRKLVLYFYPKDNTSGCTAEACSLRDHYGELQGSGYEVVGVSKDSAASHVKFKEKHSLPFPLIADVDRTLMEAMGAWGEKTMYGKKTMGGHHRKDFCGQTSEDQGARRTDIEQWRVISSASFNNLSNYNNVEAKAASTLFRGKNSLTIG